MQVRRFKLLPLYAFLRRPAAHIAQGDVGRLPHHLPEGAGENHLSLPGHFRCLHEHDLPAHAGPGKSGGDARLRRPLPHVVEIFLGPQVAGHVTGVHADRVSLPLGKANGYLSHDGGKTPFQVSQPRLSRILGDHLPHRPPGHLHVTLRETVLLQYPREEVPHDYLHLLLYRVAADLDNLHPVAQRGGDGQDDVRRRYEEHL